MKQVCGNTTVSHNITSSFLGVFERDVFQHCDLATPLGVRGVQNDVQRGGVCWQQIVEVKSEERRVGAHVEA